MAVATTLGMRMIVSNLTGEPVDVSLSGFSGKMEALLLDEDSFAAACADPGWRGAAPRVRIDGALRLGPYAIAEIA